MLSIPHLIIIFIVVLLVFGPEKLPALARALGKAMAEFRRVTADLRLTVEDEMRELERHASEIERQTAPATPAALPDAPPGVAPGSPPEQSVAAAVDAPATPQEKPTETDAKPA